jgi:hypothetical protein
MPNIVVAHITVQIDGTAIQQSADMFYNAQLDYGRKYANWLRLAFNRTIDLLKQSPMTTGKKASMKKRRRLNVPRGVTLLECKVFAPVQAVYKVENNGSHTTVTILEFSETYWPQSLLPLPTNRHTP